MRWDKPYSIGSATTKVLLLIITFCLLIPEIADAKRERSNKEKNRNEQKSKPKTKSLSAEEYLMQKKVEVPPAPTANGVCVRISLENQRAWLYQDGNLLNTSAVCTGKPGYSTPKGKFFVINKHKEWTSTIYHVPMPYFLRLNPGVFGLHQGVIKTSPASHGCIRLPAQKASEFFSVCSIGTPVWIEE